MKPLFCALLIFLLTGCYVYRPLEATDETPLPPLNEQLQKDKFYEINSGGKTYKVKAVNWEGDSLVAHVNMKEKNEMKFHKNDIAAVNHRQFSRGRSDALTVGIYAGIAALVLLLFQ